MHLITHVNTTPANIAEAKCTARFSGRWSRLDVLRTRISPMPGTLPRICSCRVKPSMGFAWWARSVIAPAGSTTSKGRMGWSRLRLTGPPTALTALRGTARSGGIRFSMPMGIATSESHSPKQDCAGCPERARCTRAKAQPRSLQLQPQPQQAAIDRMRAYLESDTGRRLYAKCAGAAVEVLISQKPKHLADLWSRDGQATGRGYRVDQNGLPSGDECADRPFAAQRDTLLPPRVDADKT